MPEQLVFDRRTPEADSYRGPAEVATGLFRGPPEQIVSAHLMGQVAATLADRLRTTRGPMLRMRAWADTSPSFWTDYRLELTVAAPQAVASAGYATQAAPFPFLIVGAVLLALGLVALAAWQVSNIEWPPLGLSLALAAAVVILLLMAKR